MIINCIQCNTELTGKYSNRSKFCSIKCSSKFFNNNYENVCLNCSSTFKGRKENTIVVSMLANRIKTDAKIEDIGKVFNFYKKLIKTKT